jgi:hypothetical protein
MVTRKDQVQNQVALLSTKKLPEQNCLATKALANDTVCIKIINIIFAARAIPTGKTKNRQM